MKCFCIVSLHVAEPGKNVCCLIVDEKSHQPAMGKPDWGGKSFPDGRQNPVWMGGDRGNVGEREGATRKSPHSAGSRPSPLVNQTRCMDKAECSTSVDNAGKKDFGC